MDAAHFYELLEGLWTAPVHRRRGGVSRSYAIHDGAVFCRQIDASAGAVLITEAPLDTCKSVPAPDEAPPTLGGFRLTDRALDLTHETRRRHAFMAA